MKQEGKFAAVVSYLAPLGWLIALFIHLNHRAPLSAWHLRQSLLLHLSSLLLFGLQVSMLYIPVVGWLLGFLLLLAGIAWLILWAIGIIFAFSGEMRSVPLAGHYAQKLFSGLK
jgi:uncharacterized membrane protein